MSALNVRTEAIAKDLHAGAVSVIPVITIVSIITSVIQAIMQCFQPKPDPSPNPAPTPAQQLRSYVNNRYDAATGYSPRMVRRVQSQCILEARRKKTRLNAGQSEAMALRLLDEARGEKFAANINDIDAAIDEAAIVADNHLWGGDDLPVDPVPVNPAPVATTESKEPAKV